MDFRAMSQVPALRVIFFSHLVPIVWTTQSDWLPPAYSIYNTLFLITLLWSLHARESEDAIFMASAINVFSIVFDAIIVGMYYGVANSTGFGTFMIITNLLLRPVTSLVLLRFYNERSGRYSSNPLFGGFGSPFGVSPRSAYEDIDSRPHQSVPGNDEPGQSASTSVPGYVFNDK